MIFSSLERHGLVAVMVWPQTRQYYWIHGYFRARQLVLSSKRRIGKDSRKRPHFLNFEALLQRFVKFTHDTLEFARRETISYCDQFVQEAANVAPTITTEELAAKVVQYFESTAQLEAKVRRSELGGAGNRVERRKRTVARKSPR